MSALRTIVLLLIGGVLLLFIYMQRTEVAYDKPYGEIQVTSPNAFALIELFSSQNCARCNDAEAMISDIVHQVELLDMPVYVLNFHTDTLDTYAWQDPYAQSLFTDRFRAYVMGQGRQNDELPQIIFNGHNILTTPNRLKTYRLIEEFLQTHHNSRIDIWGEMSGKRFLQIYAKSEGVESNQPLILHTALVEKSLEHTAQKGPCMGKALVNDNIVRELLSIPLPQSGQARIDVFIKDHYNRDNLTVIAYLQNEKTLEIIAANHLTMDDVSEMQLSSRDETTNVPKEDGFEKQDFYQYDPTPAGFQ